MRQLGDGVMKGVEVGMTWKTVGTSCGGGCSQSTIVVVQKRFTTGGGMNLRRVRANGTVEQRVVI